jgi:thiamine biosynthesis lipoprotein
LAVLFNFIMPSRSVRSRVNVGWLLISTFFTGCISNSSRITSQHQRYEFEQAQMGLPFRIVLYAPNALKAKESARAAFKRIEQLNAIMSDYDLDSELSQLSRGSGQGRTVRLSDDLWRVLERSQELAQKSHGAFDITVGPYVNLWRKARRDRQLPDPGRLETAGRSVGYHLLRLNKQDHTAQLLAPDMRLDLGGIAKGYAVDEALAVLTHLGIRRALVAGGGDMAVSDPPPGQKGWRIELQPIDVTNAPPPQFVLLKRGAIATSGDLFQRLEIDGRRYSHIIDPRTGLGLTDHSLVTVIARDCMTADSLTKVLSVLGPDLGMKLIESNPAAAARVTRLPDGQLEVKESSRFATFLTNDLSE